MHDDILSGDVRPQLNLKCQSLGKIPWTCALVVNVIIAL